MGISLPIPSIKSKNLQFSDLAPYKIVSSRDAGHHRESMGLHPTPCTEQAVNRDLRIPAVCLSGFFTIAFMSVTPQAVPARCTPAFSLSLVRSCQGSTSLERHIDLQPTMKMSRSKVSGKYPFTYRIWERPFCKETF